MKYLSLFLSAFLSLSVVIYAQKNKVAAAPTSDTTAKYHQVNSQILELYSAYPIVAIGEVHRSDLSHKWLKTLISEKNFPDKVDNIVVEFGASKYQAVMDDFVYGKQVPDSLFKKCWRETTGLVVWDHQVYEEFFREVRKINQGLPKEKKIRVLLGDPTFEETFQINRDENAFNVIRKEVLTNKQTALIIYGDMHLGKKDVHSNYKNDSSQLVQQLEKHYPGKTFNIWTGLKTINPAIGEIIQKEKITKPAFLRTSQTALGNLDFSIILPSKFITRDREGNIIDVQNDHPMAMKDVFDGILYLGTWEEITHIAPLLQTTYDDSLYLNELIRRASTRKELFRFHLDFLLFEKTKRSTPYKTFINTVQTADSTNIRREYNNLRKLFPDFHLIYAGYDLMEQKQLKQAIFVFEFATKEHPTDSFLHQSLADAYLKAGDKRNAIKYYQESLKLDPDATDAKLKLENLQKKS